MNALAASSAASKKAILSVSSSSAASLLRWSIGGWIFFIVENAVLSENRDILIQGMGGQQQESNYRTLYGTISTIATISILYSYRKIQLASAVMPASLMRTNPTDQAISVGRVVQSWLIGSTGWIMASQALPKMQIPIELVQSPETGRRSVQLACPFDFSADKQRRADDDDGASSTSYTPHGVERVTRHAALWSLALVTAGPAVLQSSWPATLWWLGPTAVAWLGGMHQDSRYRRNMGGNLDPFVESQTSALPFVALLTGKQGNTLQAASQLVQEEMKWSNAGLALGVATILTFAGALRGGQRRIVWTMPQKVAESLSK